MNLICLQLLVCGQELCGGVFYSILDLLSQQPAASGSRRPSALTRSSSGTANGELLDPAPSTTIYLMRDGIMHENTLLCKVNCVFIVVAGSSCLPKNKEIAPHNLEDLQQRGVIVTTFAEFVSDQQ